jgi:hypothetical protein
VGGGAQEGVRRQRSLLLWKFSRQYPFVLLATVGFIDDKAFRTEEDRKVGMLTAWSMQQGKEVDT